MKTTEEKECLEYIEQNSYDIDVCANAWKKFDPEIIIKLIKPKIIDLIDKYQGTEDELFKLKIYEMFLHFYNFEKNDKTCIIDKLYELRWHS